MYKVNLWMLVDGEEFYDYIDFPQRPTVENLGMSVYEKYNNMTAYFAIHGEDDTCQTQVDIYYQEEHPDYDKVFKAKLLDYLS